MTEKSYNCPIPKENLVPYVFGGNATFTLYSAKTGLRYTFKIKREPNSYWYRVMRLFGDDNTKDYRYIGCIYQNENSEGPIKWKESAYSEAMKQINFFFRVLAGEYEWPKTMYFYPSGRCARCGRLLTTPESVTTGFGPKCTRHFL